MLFGQRFLRGTDRSRRALAHSQIAIAANTATKHPNRTTGSFFNKDSIF
jgi:hypothetical protein